MRTISRRSIERRIEILEQNAIPPNSRPRHCVVLPGDPEPSDLPPGSTVHRIVFVDPAGNGRPADPDQQFDRLMAGEHIPYIPLAVIDRMVEAADREQQARAQGHP